jgi:formiminotetrahydrofolate cyclodeaminase
MLRDLSIADLLTAFSSSAPTPGGGSASALASAVGASLLLMVAALPKTRTGSDEDRAALTAAAETLAALRHQLAAAVDGDAAAYDRVVAAYKLPKGAADEQAVRKTAIQEALRAATEVPLGVMRHSARALEAAAVIAAHGYRSAASDVGVAIALLSAGAAGARLNVDVNLESIADQAYRSAVGAEARELIDRARAIGQRGEELLRDR